MLPATIWHDYSILNISMHTSSSYGSSILATTSLIERALIPWFDLPFMSSYHHPMNSISWGSWWNTCFLFRLVNLLMRIPSENLEDLAYPHLADVSFLTWCMMSLVLDDFILSFNVQWGSQELYPSCLTAMDFVLHDSHGDVTSSSFYCFHDATMHLIIIVISYNKILW